MFRFVISVCLSVHYIPDVPFVYSVLERSTLYKVHTLQGFYYLGYTI